VDFIEMVNDLNLDYDDTELREVERELTSQIQRKGPENLALPATK
jgi:hypothetical protein